MISVHYPLPNEVDHRCMRDVSRPKGYRRPIVLRNWRANVFDHCEGAVWSLGNGRFELTEQRGPSIGSLVSSRTNSVTDLALRSGTSC